MLAGKNNLRTPSTDEAREIGRSGGIASGKKRREKKMIREALLLLLDEPARDDTGNLTGKTIQEEIAAGLIRRAMTGDPRAFEIIRDTIGEKPVNRVVAGVAPNAQTVMNVERALFGEWHALEDGALNENK